MKKTWLLPILAAALLLYIAPPAPSSASASSDILPAQRVKLDNGLTVITQEIHTAPVVYISVWYDVGSRNEIEGITGISHALEHMMFKGSRKYPEPGQSDKIIRRIGGMGNAGTSNDYTVYYEKVPAGMEDAALDIEADRMTNALIRQKDFDSEMKVVKEERKMRNEDSPTGLFWEEIDAAAFKIHPYGRPVIGWMSDIDALNADKLKTYYKSHYAPSNAILVICGDFKTNELMKKIKAIFGKAPKLPKPAHPNLAEPAQRVEKRIVYPTLKTNIPEVVYAWHVPTYGDPDSPALEILSNILGSGRQSRLNKELVDGGLAASASSVHETNADPYLFHIEVELIPGTDPLVVEKKLEEMVDKLKTEPVTDFELKKAKNRFRADDAFGSQSISAYGQKIGWFQLSAGDYAFWDKYLEAADKVTAADITRVANKYLVNTNRTAGILIPQKGAKAGGGDDNTREIKRLERNVYNRRPAGPITEAAAKKAAAVKIPNQPATHFASKVKKTVLPNGLTLLVYENHAFPTIEIYGFERGAGSFGDPAGKSGLAKLASQALRRGTETRTYDQINDALEFVGADFDFMCGNEQLVFDGRFLSRDFDMGAELFADVLQHPSFPAEGVEIERQVAAAEAEAELKSNKAMAWRTFVSVMFGDHPYANPKNGTPEGIKAITRDDLAAYHKSVYRPERTIISISGDVSAEHAAEIVSKFFGDWKSGDAAAFNVPPVKPAQGVQEKSFAMPEMMQDVFFMGFPAPLPTDKDYVSFKIMTDILAGTDLTSRLYDTIREKAGLVYYVYGYDLPRTALSTFQVSGGLSPENLPRAVELVRKEIKRIQTEPVTKAELEDAKTFAAGALTLSLESNSQIARTMAEYEYYGRPISDLDEYPAKVKSLTAADITAAAKKWLTPDSYSLGFAGPPVKEKEKK